MDIVIIGTGNVATVLGKKFFLAGHRILQVYGRTKEAADTLATGLSAQACYEWISVTKEAEICLLALSDQALPEVSQHLHFTNQLVVHTAGAVSIDVLKGISSNYGVFYPYQTIRKETMPAMEIPLLIDANNETSKQKLMSLAKSISSVVSEAGDRDRFQYHLCAVIVNNFSNYLYTVTENYCQAHGLDFKNLLPLVDETAGRLHQFSPRRVQTGPAIRKDIATIDAHLALLKNDPALSNLYKVLSESILQFPW